MPVFKERRRWSDRWKALESPLFPGYVFARFDLTKRLPVLSAPGVLYVVGLGRAPAAVDPDEMDAIQLVAKCGAAAQPCPYLEVGQTVRIGDGPLTGVTGIILRLKSQTKLVLSISLLKRSISVETDKASITALTSAA